ncbi:MULTISPECIES: ScbR family autoregulator-binding transcription factor [unclassified Streptomyces]|jgi:AcrR family transcriptional regulator|uniref:ScbR family autoregulator-binding transcription factor n=1 Tax=unclassified Streptomyces TaxID=2593676 RepID=UPI002E263A3E
MATQERGLATRRMILEAAGSVFAERGYSATTVADVLKRLGLTRGAVYFHFSSKEELARTVLASQADIPVVVRDIKLQELVDLGLVFACQLTRDPVLQGSVRLSLELDSVGLDRKLPFRTWVDRNHRILEQARAQGELRPHVDLMETAELLCSCFTGVQLFSQVMTGWVDLEARIRTLLKHVLPSIAEPSVLVQLDLGPERGLKVGEELSALAAAREAGEGEAGDC